MLKLNNDKKSPRSLLQKIPQNKARDTTRQYQNNLIQSSYTAYGQVNEQYDVKIKLESIHYTGKDYGYGWTFVISTLKRHWISQRIHIQQGRKSPVNKDVYKNTIHTSFYNLQHLPITICAQHTGGFSIETTLQLKPALFKIDLLTKSIYPQVTEYSEGFHFHELHKVRHKNTQIMFVLDFEITAKQSACYKNQLFFISKPEQEKKRIGTL